ncbi:MAG: protein kinase, partial [Victivallales bacterium]|nr:protein kinase [Victivallales bacterium]
DKKGNAKLLDFGLAKDTEALVSMLSMTGQSIRTPPYMSPEQHEGLKEIDVRSDLYSLGATAYHLLTGHSPFPGPTASSFAMQHIHEIPEPAHKVNKDIPLNLSQVIDRLLAKKPEKRHQKPAELIEDLNRVERGEVPLKLYKPKKSRKHNPIITFAAVVAAVIITVVSAWSVQSVRSSNAESIIADIVAKARNQMAENNYDEAQNILSGIIREFSAENPKLVAKAEKLRDEIPARKSSYLKRSKLLAEKRREADEKRTQQQNETSRKNSLATCLRNSERWLEREDTVRKAIAEIERGYAFVKTDDERATLDVLRGKAKKAICSVRAWAAVVDFDVSSKVKGDIGGRDVAVKLEQSLGTNYRLVTRNQVSKALKELQFQTSDLADSENAKRFGKIVGAEYLVTGSVVQIGREITIAAQIFAIETGAIKQTAQVSTDDINEFNYLFREIARILAMNVAEKRTYMNEKFNYPKHLTDGKSAMTREEYASAVRSFKRALAAKRTPEAANLLKSAEIKAEEQRVADERKS